MTTLLSLASVKPTPEQPLDGVDCSPVLLKGENLPERPFYWSSLSNPGARAEAMRLRAWKLVIQRPKPNPVLRKTNVWNFTTLTTIPPRKTTSLKQQSERDRGMLKQLKYWYNKTQRTATKQEGGW